GDAGWRATLFPGESPPRGGFPSVGAAGRESGAHGQRGASRFWKQRKASRAVLIAASEKNPRIWNVTELVLDNCLCVNGEIEGLNDAFKKLEFLSMANVELSSLARLPSLNKLRKDEEDDDDYVEEGEEEEEEEEEGLRGEKRKRDAEDDGEEEDD
uniref:Acidic leucine-rich nuclear phosphoprotein 32 family member n=1 Tax=Equus caballus TaxID=9796 RepID=A0A9L0SQI7_HORSE